MLFGVQFVAPPDCAFYLAWTKSLAHLTLDFSPAFEALEMPTRYCYLTPNGRLANDWPMGTGLMLLPVGWLGPAAMHAWILALAIAATALWLRVINCAPTVKAWATAGMALGTPLLFYGLFGPFFSHVISYAIVTAFLCLWTRGNELRGRAFWLPLGMLLGLAVIIRPQNLLLGIVFVTDFSWWKRTEFRSTVSKIWLPVAAGFLLGIAPRLPAYQVIYGNAFALPKLDEMHWFNPALSKTLLSDYHGILPWTPVMALAFAGLLAGLKSHWRVAGGLLLVLASQVYVNAANEVWWSGGSFGNRRLTDYSIVVAFGLAFLMERAGRARMAAIAGIALCCAWSLTLALAERRLIVPLDRYVPFSGREFWQGLAQVYTEPGKTVLATMAFGRANDALPRILAGVGLALMTLILIPLIRFAQKDILLRWTSRSLATALILATVICSLAAWRTPPLHDEALEKSLPSGSTILWDNYIELAGYHLSKGELGDAETVSAKAVSLMPDAPAAYWYRGVARLKAGKSEEAAADFRRVLTLNPEHNTARELLIEAERMTKPASRPEEAGTAEKTSARPASDWRVK